MLKDSWPDFLDRLDSDPRGSMEEFYMFLVKVLQTRPPEILRTRSEDDRQDFYHRLFLHFCENGYARLRKYRDRGKPFSAWLLRAAWNLAITEYRRQKPEQLVDDVSPIADDNPQIEAHTDVLRDEGIRECLSRLSDSCQTLIKGWAVDGMSLDDLRVLMGLPPGEKSVKRAWDEIHRKCKVQLVRCLKDRGIEAATL